MHQEDCSWATHGLKAVAPRAESREDEAPGKRDIILYHESATPLHTEIRRAGGTPSARACWLRMCPNRAVAQLGSAPALGAGGRRFKSDQPDHHLHASMLHTKPESTGRYSVVGGG